ncbi:MAG: sugar-binding protein [Lachnospiraceae bacterium]|nr:sugar-binding protein [Lachnospiraceae bacterium]
MKKKKWLAGLLCAAMVLSAAGCGSSGSTQGEKDAGQETAAEGSSTESEASSEAEGEGEIVLSDLAKNHKNDGEDIIGISMPAEHLPRWNWDGNYLKKNFEDAGYKVDIRWADNKIDTQQQDIHELVDNGADILLIAAVKGTELSEVLEEAKEAEVPVIAYDRIIESDSVEYYVSFDNDMVGQLEGEHIRDSLDLDNAGDNTYNIEIVSGDSNDKNADGYYYGAMGVLEPYFESGVLNVPSGQKEYNETETFQWSTEFAKERVTGILSSYYSDRTLDGVLCANDTAALGVAQAIDESYSGKNRPYLTGQDGDVDNLKNIMEGKQTMTVYKCLPHETKAMYDLTVAFMKGEEIDESLIEKSQWDFDVVFAPDRYSNGTEYMKSFLLTPIAITKDNLMEELVDKGFYEYNEADGTFSVVD